MNQLRWYEGRTALITGASSALGRAFAEALARRGTHLLLLDSAPERLPAWAAWLSRVNAVQVDVMRTDPHHAGAAELVCAALEYAGQWMDLCITSVGGGEAGRWEVFWRPHSTSQPVPLVGPRGPNLSPERTVAQALRALEQCRRRVGSGGSRAQFGALERLSRLTRRL